MSAKGYNRKRIRGYLNASIVRQLLDKERQTGYGRYPVGSSPVPLVASTTDPTAIPSAPLGTSPE